MIFERVSDIDIYILTTHPILPRKKFDVVKIGARIYIYAVNRQNELQRKQIFKGNLDTVNHIYILRQELEKNIKKAIESFGYY